MDIIMRIVLGLIGFGVFAGLMAFAMQLHSKLWREIASAYPGPDRSEVQWKRFRLVIFSQKSLISWRNYNGGVHIGVSVAGIHFKPAIWIAPLHPPIFIPYSEWTAEPGRWMLIGDLYMITTKARPETRIYIDEKDYAWVKTFMPA